MVVTWRGTAGKCHSSLERNIDPEFIDQFRLGMAARLGVIGPRLEQIFPQLLPGQGAELLNHTYALGIGTWQLCDPSHHPEGRSRPGLELLRRDVQKEMQRASIWALYL